MLSLLNRIAVYVLVGSFVIYLFSLLEDSFDSPTIVAKIPSKNLKFYSNEDFVISYNSTVLFKQTNELNVTNTLKIDRKVDICSGYFCLLYSLRDETIEYSLLDLRSLEIQSFHGTTVIDYFQSNDNAIVYSRIPDEFNYRLIIDSEKKSFNDERIVFYVDRIQMQIATRSDTMLLYATDNLLYSFKIGSFIYSVGTHSVVFYSNNFIIRVQLIENRFTYATYTIDMNYLMKNVTHNERFIVISNTHNVVIYDILNDHLLEIDETHSQVILIADFLYLVKSHAVYKYSLSDYILKSSMIEFVYVRPSLFAVFVAVIAAFTLQEIKFSS